MSNLGDFHSGCTIFDIFTTTDVSGRPALLAGNPAISLVCYKNAGADCSTAGITLAINCNGLLGVQGWSVNTNIDPAFYACGNQYQVLLRGGCVDSYCVSGYVIGRFSLNAISALRPLIHGCNRVATTSTGAVRVNWAEIENKTTAEALSCTTIFSVQSVVNTVQANPCSTIFSVQSVLNSVAVDPCAAVFSVRSVLNTVAIAPCSNVYQVETFSNSAVAKILDTAIAEPTGVFAWASGSMRTILQWLGALGSNCVRQTATVQTLRARDDLSAIATANLTCEALTVHRGSFT